MSRDPPPAPAAPITIVHPSGGGGLTRRGALDLLFYAAAITGALKLYGLLTGRSMWAPFAAYLPVTRSALATVRDARSSFCGGAVVSSRSSLEPPEAPPAPS